MAFDSSVGELTSNSYCDVNFADDFIENESHNDDQIIWESFPSDQVKQRYLRLSTKQLDLSYKWKGERTISGDGETTGQALDWPRSYVPSNDLLNYIDDTIIPKDIKKATVLLAVALFAKDRAADPEVNELKSLKADEIEMEWRDTLPITSSTIPKKVDFYCRKYGRLINGYGEEGTIGRMRLNKL